MKLNDDLLKQLPKLYAQENLDIDEHMLYLKFSEPRSGWKWYAAEYDEESRIFFGYVEGFENEWGDFSLDELEEAKTVEIDKSFKPIKFKELKKLEELNA